MDLQVFGHQSPDTDSTGSPIIWSWYLKAGEQLNFGLSGTKLTNPNTLKSLYLDPIQEAGRILLHFAYQLILPFQRENSA